MMLAQPKTEIELEQYLRAVAKLRDAREFEGALEACVQLVNDPVTLAAGLRARADIYADMRQRESEIADREALVQLGTQEPNDYFEFGIALWRVGRLLDAADAFARAIELGEQEVFHYYTNASRIHLAAVLVKLGRHEEARRECLLVPDGYSSYLPGDGVTTKEQLLDKMRSTSMRGKQPGADPE